MTINFLKRCSSRSVNLSSTSSILLFYFSILILNFTDRRFHLPNFYLILFSFLSLSIFASIAFSFIVIVILNTTFGISQISFGSGTSSGERLCSFGSVAPPMLLCVSSVPTLTSAHPVKSLFFNVGFCGVAFMSQMECRASLGLLL